MKGECKYSSTHFPRPHWMKVSGQWSVVRQFTLPAGKSLRYSLNSRVICSQRQSGCFGGVINTLSIGIRTPARLDRSLTTTLHALSWLQIYKLLPELLTIKKPTTCTYKACKVHSYISSYMFRWSTAIREQHLKRHHHVPEGLGVFPVP